MAENSLPSPSGAPVIRYAPVKTPFLDSKGNVTKPWLKWLNSVYIGIQGADADSVTLAFVAEPRGYPDLPVDWESPLAGADASDQAVVLAYGAEGGSGLRDALADMALAASFATGYQGEESARIAGLETLVASIAEATSSAANAGSGGAPSIIFDTHAHRLANYPPANYAVGTEFIESDTHVVYVVKFDAVTSLANEWYYASGTCIGLSASRVATASLSVYDDGYPFQSIDHFVSWRWNGTSLYWLFTGGEDSGTLANLALAGGAGGPTANDIGMKYGAQDVGHRFVWTGSAFEFAPGDPGSGWTTFTPALFGPSTWFALIGSGGASVAVTESNGATSAPQPYGAWVSPVTGASLYVRI